MRPHRPTPSFRLFSLFVGLVVGTLLGCTDEDVECDPRTEIQVRYGSDVAGEPSEEACEAAPASCGEQPDCACLQGQMLDGGLDLDFCLDEGDCDDSDGVVKVVCPGG